MSDGVSRSGCTVRKVTEGIVTKGDRIRQALLLVVPVGAAVALLFVAGVHFFKEDPMLELSYMLDGPSTWDGDITDCTIAGTGDNTSIMCWSDFGSDIYRVQIR